jgi:hypothetical protein
MEYDVDIVAYAMYKLLSLVQVRTEGEIMASIAWLFFSSTEAYETQLNTRVLKLENVNIHCEGG